MADLPPARGAEQPASRVSAHALDVLFKLEAEQLVRLLPQRFALSLAPVRRHLPTELPQLSLHLQRLDRVFELTDGTILDLEFEADLRVVDLRRFLGYGLGLLDTYPGQPVHTVALCGPRTRRVPPPFDLAPIPYRLTCVLIGDQDGRETLARLRALAASGMPWSEADRLDLLLLPLMRHRQGTERVVRAGLDLAEALPAVEQPRVMGALLALAYHYAGETVLNRLLESLMSSNLLDQLFAERLEQRFVQGRAQGERMLLRRLLADRFGAIPPALEARIADADADALTALFDRVLAGAGLDALI